MSRVLYEAMACGAVPVATDIRGNRDALTPETGVLVPERDPAAMARALGALLADAPRLAALRQAGIARARESFDIRRHARGVEQFYREVLEREGPRQADALAPRWRPDGLANHDDRARRRCCRAEHRAPAAPPRGWGPRAPGPPLRETPFRRGSAPCGATTSCCGSPPTSCSSRSCRSTSASSGCSRPTPTTHSSSSSRAGRQDITDAARRAGLANPTLVMVTFYGQAPGARFTPEDIQLQSRGRLVPAGRPSSRCHPRGAPCSWISGSRRSRSISYDEGISWFEDLSASYQSGPQATWSRALQLLQRERARVQARAQSLPTQPNP